MRYGRLPNSLRQGAPVVENVVLLAPMALVIVLAVAVLLKKLLDGQDYLKRESRGFFGD